MGKTAAKWLPVLAGRLDVCADLDEDCPAVGAEDNGYSAVENFRHCWKLHPTLGYCPFLHLGAE